jgi:hypothetical protein
MLIVLTKHSSSLKKIRVEKGVPREVVASMDASLGVKGLALPKEGHTGGQGLADEEGTSTSDDDPDD